MGRISINEKVSRELKDLFIERISKDTLTEASTRKIIDTLIVLIKNKDQSKVVDRLIKEIQSRGLADFSIDDTMTALYSLVAKVYVKPEEEMTLTELKDSREVLPVVVVDNLNKLFQELY